MLLMFIGIYEDYVKTKASRQDTYGGDEKRNLQIWPTFIKIVW